MNPFYSKDGRLIVPVDHYADFTGKNNSSKSKILLWLQFKKGAHYTARQLHNDTGVNYDYLRGRLSFWYNIRYVNREVRVRQKGSPAWAYCIAERGEIFISRIPQDKRNEFIEEINLWRQIQSHAKQ